MARPAQKCICMSCHSALRLSTERSSPQTCKAFQSTLSSSSNLQYKIELGCAGLQDDCCCPTCRVSSIPQRRDRLLDLTRGWKEATVRQTTRVPLAAWDGWTYELQGGLFARASMSPLGGPQMNSEIELVELPSSLHPRGLGTRILKVDFEVQDFSFNVEEDLIVFFEWPGEYVRLWPSLCQTSNPVT